MHDSYDPVLSRRKFIGTTSSLIGASALMSMVPASIRNAAWAAGSDAPEKTKLTIGFIPLTDCASVIMAHELGLDKKYGLEITASKETSWAAVRDKLVLASWMPRMCFTASFTARTWV